MARHTVVTMPGDGIGKVVLEESLRVLEAVGFEADYVHADIGWEREGSLQQLHSWVQKAEDPLRGAGPF